jgi:hypothetical protein
MVVQLIFADTPICGIVGRDARTEQLAGDWDFTKSLLPPAPLRRSAFFGRYVLEPVVWDSIAQISLDPRGELQLTEALHLLCNKSPLFGHFFEGSHYDAGDPLGYLRANVEISLQDPRLRQPLLDYLLLLHALAEDSASCPPSTLLGSSAMR